VVEWISPSPALATVGPQDDANTQVEAAPAHEHRPSSQNLTAPQRIVQVEIRPAPVSAAHPPPSAAPQRRSTIAGQRHPAAQLTDASRSAESTPGPSTVHVHIGRVDVRAVMPPAAPVKPAARPAAPRATLEDYLNGRKGGSQP
jgi:hypothetical protein